jgi:S1-C subfamily serine protease
MQWSGPTLDLDEPEQLTSGDPARSDEAAPRRWWPELSPERSWWPDGAKVRRWWPVAALLIVVLIAALILVLKHTGDPGPAPITKADVDRAVAAGVAKAQQDARNATPDAAAADRKILPSLVSITTAGQGGRSELGAGVVINAQGAVITALHVVSGGGAIKVRFADNTQSTGHIETQKPDQDLAVLSVDQLPSVVVPAVMGGGAQVGDAVFAVGHPLGLTGSLSAGVVSALGRTIHPDNTRTLRGLIQFDAAVNPGNSGGPLLDRDGQVVGIVTALANPSNQPYFIGIGFAVPIETAGAAAGGPSK